jgi:hypothetical protein
MTSRGAILPGKEPHPHNFVGMVVSFDLRRAGGLITREKGEVLEQKWLGLTERGQIPEYELLIRGKTGKTVLARVTEDHVMEIE